MARKTKLARLMFERGISMKKLHEDTGIAYPTLFNIEKGRKTSVENFRKRTIRDLENYLKLPAEQFIGWEEES